MASARAASPSGPQPLRSLAVGFALASLLASGLAPPLQGESPGSVQTDLEIISLDPGAPQVGGAGNVSALLSNHGPNAAATFSVFFGYQNASAPLGDGSNLTYPVNATNFTDPRNATGQPDPTCLSETQGLKAGCSARVVYVWIPNATRAGAGNVTARAFPGAVYTDPQPGNDAAIGPIFVAAHGLTLQLDAADNHAKETRPGGEAFYSLTLANAGNVEETLSFTVASAQWPNVSSSVAQAVVPIGASRRFLALVRAPPNGVPNQANANVTVANATALAAGTVRLTLPGTRASDQASAQFGFEPAPPNQTFIAPGGRINLTIPVRNSGGAEDVLRWETSSTAPQGWTLSPEGFQALRGPAGADSTEIVQVRADATLSPGALAAFSARITSENSGASMTANATLRVEAPDLVVPSVALERDAVYRGDSVPVILRVENTGLAQQPKPVRLALETVQGATRTLVAQEIISGLLPGEGRTPVLRWDTSNLSGAVQLVATIDPENSLPEVHEDNNAASRAITVRIPGVTVDAPADRTAKPGDNLTYPAGSTFVVWNTGNAAESIDVTVRSLHGWANRSAIVELGPGEKVDVPLQVPVPALPGTLAEPLVAQAFLVNRTATLAEARSTIRIDDHDPPVLDRLDGPSFVELGTNGDFAALLHDAVGVRSVQLMMQLPDGNLRVQPMEQGIRGSWTASIVLAQPGTVRYWIRAQDATPANNTLDTNATAASLTVGVRSAPLIEMLEPRNNSVVRSGTLVRLQVSDIHGIGAVAVDHEGSRTDLDFPYAISTSNFSEGTHNLAVTAINRYGNAATRTFALTIDNTPPQVRDIRITPGRPDPGQPFQVEGVVSRDTAVGSVQVTKDTERINEVPAQLGAGLLTASLTLPQPGHYVLSVRAEDAAGNAATLDVPVDVGNAVPGFPAECVIAALAIGALAVRRRR